MFPNKNCINYPIIKNFLSAANQRLYSYFIYSQFAEIIDFIYTVILCMLYLVIAGILYLENKHYVVCSQFLLLEQLSHSMLPLSII